MKLLNRSVRLYLVYSALVLIIAIPVLYISIQRIVIEDVDESLLQQKDDLRNKLKRNPIDTANYSNQTGTGIMLDSTGSPLAEKDSFFTNSVYDKIADENTASRVLQSNIVLDGKLYIVQFKSSLLDSEDLIESIVFIVAVILLLIVFGLVIINRLLSKQIWKPFYETLQKLRDFRIEKADPLHFEKSATYEFETLNNAIKALTDLNIAVFKSQKEFTENASHELQTPLAIFQGKLDLLMQTAGLTREQSELISDLTDVNQRINRLNKSLLLLSKIDNHQFAETEKLQIVPLLDGVLENYKFQIEQHKIRVHKELGNDIQVKANRMLIEIMLGNILSNAIRHNRLGGELIITSGVSSISFTNTSTSGALNSEKVFQRFQKQPSGTNGSGLGLHIAKKIADYYNYRIDYRFENGEHTFQIDFANK